MTQEFHFPILVVRNNKSIFFARTYDELTITTNSTLKRGIYNDMILLDSSGTKFYIKNASKVNNVGIFWGITIFLTQKIRIVFNVEKKENLDLQSFKSNIIQIYKNRTKVYGSNLNKYEKDILNNTETFSQILEFLTEKFYKVYPV